MFEQIPARRAYADSKPRQFPEPGNPQTLSETDRAYVEYLAAKGNGHEDVVFKCRRAGVKGIDHPDIRAEIKRLVLHPERTTARERGAQPGR
jgi:hypothetical protein